MRALSVALVAAAFILGGCGKRDIADTCPKGLVCSAPGRLPVTAFCEHVQRRFEQMAEYEIQHATRLRATLERLIRRTIALDANAASTVRANPWHEPSARISAALTGLALSDDALLELRHELRYEGMSPSVSLGRLPVDIGCQLG